MGCWPRSCASAPATRSRDYGGRWRRVWPRRARDGGGAAPARRGAVSAHRAIPGPHRTNGELIDRLEETQRALLARFADAGHDPGTARAVCEEILGRGDRGVGGCCASPGGDRPQLLETDREIPSLIGALQGRTCRRAVGIADARTARRAADRAATSTRSTRARCPPSSRARPARKLADALLERHRAEHGAFPESVGIVVWGTAAMRTHGDDAGEVLALLGVRPVWQQETRRIVGLEAIPLDELGRPRIDVTLRISGFFRDAFPPLVRCSTTRSRSSPGLTSRRTGTSSRAHVLDERRAAAAGAGAASAAGARDDARLRGASRALRRRAAAAARRRQLARRRRPRRRLRGLGRLRLRRAGSTASPRATAMRGSFARIDVAVKNQSTRASTTSSTPTTTSQSTAAWSRTVRAPAGAAPARATSATRPTPRAPRARDAGRGVAPRVPRARRQPPAGSRR